MKEQNTLAPHIADYEKAVADSAAYRKAAFDALPKTSQAPLAESKPVVQNEAQARALLRLFGAQVPGDAPAVETTAAPGVADAEVVHIPVPRTEAIAEIIPVAVLPRHE